MTKLTLTLDPELLNALEQMAQAADNTVQDVILDALHAYVRPPEMALDMAALGDAILLDLEAAEVRPPLEPQVAVEILETMKAFLLPEDRTQLMLGEELWLRLIGTPFRAHLNAEARARQTAVMTVSELLRGTLTDGGVRRWWTRPRSSLRGRTPLELLTPGWAPDEPPFREILALAEADAGFAAT